MNSTLDVIDAISKATLNLTEEFKKFALASGWPTEIVMQVSVIDNDGDLEFDYPDEIAAQVEDLEYGTQTTPPNAAMRNFMSGTSTRGTGVTRDLVDDILGDLGAFN